MSHQRVQFTIHDYTNDRVGLIDSNAHRAPVQRSTRRNEGTSSTSYVRRATRADAKRVIDLIVGLAKFERLKPPSARAKARLFKHIFDRKLANVFVATTDGKLVGYALYFYTYSSFVAKPSLYLEDIFVDEKARGKNIGQALFKRCLEEARRMGCGRMEWMVLDWNQKAIGFYEKLGAKQVSDQRLFRLEI